MQGSHDECRGLALASPHPPSSHGLLLEGGSAVSAPAASSESCAAAAVWHPQRARAESLLGAGTNWFQLLARTLMSALVSSYLNELNVPG